MSLYKTDDPVADAERYYRDKRKPIGECEQCGYPVYDKEQTDWEEEMPYRVEGVLLHEQCIMKFAAGHWKL